MMRSILLLTVCFYVSFYFTQAQEVKINSYTFEIVNEARHTTVKDQQSAGTCWSYATTSFVEAELLRQGAGEFDLSELFFVRHAYSQKAEKYVRMQGKTNFSQGGEPHDVINLIRSHGFVPDDQYMGLSYGTDSHQHSELEAVYKSILDAVLKNPNKKLSTAWKDAFEGVQDAYLGQLPEKFEYNGSATTPKEFVKTLKFNPDDYVELGSYTHHPFYEEFIVEIPDNWAWGSVHNLPLDELMEVMNAALEAGYTLVWAADVSNKGFSQREGLAVYPADENSFSEALKKPVKQMDVTQEVRQQYFDNYDVQDDHSMHIVGLAKDANGKYFYKVKNSWNEVGTAKGYFYASESYMRLQTIFVMVHKDAIPKTIRKKLNLK